MEQSIYNKHLVLSIIELIKGYKEVHKANYALPNGSRNYTKDCEDSLKYLLNQTVRQFHLDSSHFLVSKGAKKCWDELVIGGQRIEDYFNGEIIKCKKVENLKDYPRYVGASKNGVSTCIVQNDEMYSFKFNDLFHCEHIVPVCQIVDTLVNLEFPTETSVNEILNKIYICKMLKKEDRNISKKSNRGEDLDYLRIINSIYREAGIEVE